jgi:hypothetical protein
MKRDFLLVEMEVQDDETVKHLYEMVDTALYQFLFELNELMGSEDEDRQVLVFISDKLLQLCRFLEGTE